jgi:hypothetical protein
MTTTYFRLPDNISNDMVLPYSARGIGLDVHSNLSGRVGKSKPLIFQVNRFRTVFVVVAAAPVSKTGSDDDQPARANDKGLGNDWGPHSARPRPPIGGTIA